MDDQQVLIPDNVKIYLEGLLKEANIKGLDDKTYSQMLESLYLRLNDFIQTAILDNLTVEQLQIFTKLNEEKRPQSEIERFIAAQVPNAQQILTSVFIRFRELYLQSINQERSNP